MLEGATAKTLVLTLCLLRVNPGGALLRVNCGQISGSSAEFFGCFAARDGTLYEVIGKRSTTFDQIGGEIGFAKPKGCELEVDTARHAKYGTFECGILVAVKGNKTSRTVFGSFELVPSEEQTADVTFHPTNSTTFVDKPNPPPVQSFLKESLWYVLILLALVGSISIVTLLLVAHLSTKEFSHSRPATHATSFSSEHARRDRTTDNFAPGRGLEMPLRYATTGRTPSKYNCQIVDGCSCLNSPV